MTNTADAQLAAVAKQLRGLDPDGQISAGVMRQTFDQLYDGARTGRFRWDQLYKTEKTHFGTLIEINLQRAFAFADGTKLDYLIAGSEVDAKFSQTKWAWMLPPEAVDELCLVMTANDEKGTFSMGLVRAVLEHLNQGRNRDAKRTLSMRGRQAVVWLYQDHPMPPNTLLHLPTDDVSEIFGHRSGQKRVNELFRRAMGQVVTRTAVETVAQQLDPMKRIRGNGGARTILASEGIAIFSGDYHWQRETAAAFGLPRIREGEFISARLLLTAEQDRTRSAAVGASWWRLASGSTYSEIPADFYTRG